MAQYRSSTVTVTNGSTTITGDATEFQTNAITPGHRWARSGDNVSYVIASVDSETQITLSEAYQGATGAGVTYTIGKDVTIFQSYPLIFSGDIETATFISYALQKIDEDMNRSFDGENIAFNSPTGTLAATSVSGAIRELEDEFIVAGAMLLAGSPGGQQAYGGTDSGDDLTFNSTSHATKGFVMLGGTTGLVYDEVNNTVGIGESSPLGKFHVKTADVGAITGGISANGDDVVIENSAQAGLTFLTATSSRNNIFFGDTDDADIGYIIYQHDTEKMLFGTNTAIAIAIDGSQNVGIGEISPDTSLHITGSGAGTFITLESTNTGAATGPGINLHRNSASPLAADRLGTIFIDGEDSVGNRTTYAAIEGHIVSPTNGAEEGRINFQAMTGATLTTVFYINQGMVVGSPTGGDKGAGTINATAVYDDDVLLTDYVFDLYVDGKANKEDKILADNFNAECFNIEYFSDYWKENRHLPSMPSREEFEEDRMSIGKLSQRLWETTEIHSVHIDTLHNCIKDLETEVALLKKVA